MRNTRRKLAKCVVGIAIESHAGGNRCEAETRVINIKSGGGGSKTFRNSFSHARREGQGAGNSKTVRVNLIGSM